MTTSVIQPKGLPKDYCVHTKKNTLVSQKWGVTLDPTTLGEIGCPNWEFSWVARSVHLSCVVHIRTNHPVEYLMETPHPWQAPQFILLGVIHPSCKVDLAPVGRYLTS